MERNIKQFYYLVFFLFFISYGYFFQGGGWNQNARICLTRAMLHDLAFSIDRYNEVSIDPYYEFLNTGDWAYCNGHYYINKSPGLSFLAVLPFGITEYVAGRLSPNDSERQVFLGAYASTLCTTVVFSALLCVLLFHVCVRFLALGLTNALILTLFFGFGTLAFSYSTTFYGHMPSAFFAFLAFVLAIRINRGDARCRKLLAFYAGLSASTAVLLEPSSVFSLGLTALYLMGSPDGRRCIIAFLLGCLPAGVLQCTYNWACFGDPLASSYDYANPLVMSKVNGKLFGFPDLARIMSLLLGPYRGLFVSSPILIMALPGIILCFLTKKWLRESLMCMMVLISFLLLNASYYAWYAGSAPGPRYLLPAFPFAFLLAAFSFNKYPKTFKAVGCLSVVINMAITIVGNEIPCDIGNPLVFIFKQLLKGVVSFNPEPYSNFIAYPHILRVTEIGNWPRNFNSFNLGELLFPHHIASIVPLVLFWVVWFFLWRRLQTPSWPDLDRLLPKSFRNKQPL